ncbi:23S rRNA (pseudouridine(1915)-N(3))-methyltransferase RlmH, partial [Candidatus Saccharibacteria bacterium]|nr:23S rRNA (pseudouridine(1915)-N(3))-methyltransferase RlmH [Candidatus Saccharibacteria bacterium]
MLHIIAGGKKHSGEYRWLIEDYQKKVRKPFDFDFTFLEEEKLDVFLSEWKFPSNAFVIIADERGQEITSPELSALIQEEFVYSREVFIVIGGPFGVTEDARNRANFVWSFGKLVFPHMLARLIVSEQIYRSYEISRG